MSVLTEVLQKREQCLCSGINRKNFENYISAIASMDRVFADIVYSLLLETNVIEMEKPELIYPNYYIQKKNLLENLALYYYGKRRDRIQTEAGKRRIAICTNTWKDKGYSIGEKVINQIDRIFQYAPLFVLDLTDDNSCCSRILYQKFPVMYFPMRSNHGTSMFFHKYLAVNLDKMKQINAIYRSFDSELLEPITGGITEFPIAGKEYKRKKFGKKDGFVLVTVGRSRVV